MTRYTDLEEALQADVKDVKFRASQWRKGNRITNDVFMAACKALNTGHCPQAVMMVLADLAFNKRNAIKPADQVETFLGSLHNQETRVAYWVSKDGAGGE